MAKKSNRNYSGGIPFNLRIPQGLYAQIKEASNKTGLSIPDIVRLSAESGIHSLKRLNYNIALAIALQAEALKNPPEHPQRIEKR